MFRFFLVAFLGGIGISFTLGFIPLGLSIFTTVRPAYQLFNRLTVSWQKLTLLPSKFTPKLMLKSVEAVRLSR